jgi:hypothetical protein
MDNTVSYFRLILGGLFLFLVLTITSGITAWFDGLPWIGSAETLTLAIIIPFLSILGWRFLAMKFPVMFLGLLLLIKVVMFLGSPAGGWMVKVHPNLPQEHEEFSPFELKGSWVRTYATLWNENVSGILKTPWTEKLDFPLDWALYRNQCGTNNLPCYNELAPIVEVEGVLLLRENKKFALVADGVEEGSFSATNERGETLHLPIAKTFEEAGKPQYQLPKGGVWKIFGKLQYQAKTWSLIPVLVEPDGIVGSDLGRDVIWQSEDRLLGSLSYIGFYRVLSFIIDGGVFLFLLLWMGWTGRKLVRTEVLNVPFTICSISAVVMPFVMAPFFDYILKVAHVSFPVNFSYLGFSVTGAGLGLLFWAWWKKDFRNFQRDRVVLSVFLLFGPALLFYFSDRWWSTLGQWFLWSVGDDWTFHQVLARRIFVDGQWLKGGSFVGHWEEGAFITQPLHRYFVGFFHWLFGQSSFVQHMADVWSIVGAVTLCASLAMKFRLSAFIVYIAIIGYLMATFIGSFRYLIGRGLIEYHAMFFMVLTGWVLCQSREKGFGKTILAGLFAVIAYGMRQDHIVAVAALAFFIIEPIQGTARDIWKTYWEQIKIHWKLGFTYVGILTGAVFIVCFRNWWVGGEFLLTAAKRPDAMISPGLNLDSTYYILTASMWPDRPQISALILFFGTLLGAVSLVWRPNFLRTYPMSLGLVLFGYMLTYSILSVNSAGYVPRFCVALLPFATLSVIFVLDSLVPPYILKGLTQKG